MKETLSIFVTIIIFVLLIVIFPLYNYFERQDDMSYNLVLKATTGFIDEVINCGYIDQDMYTDYIFELTSTGNLYNIELEGHKKILVKADGANEYKEQYVIDYNDDIFSDKITNTSNINDKIIKDGVYRLEVGDKIYIKVVNSSTTTAEALINSIVPNTTQKNIRLNYGGIVQNNTWKQADSPLFEDFGIKLSFNLNTNGNNNASYNNDDLKNGITHTIHTGTKYTTMTIPNATPTRPNCTFKGWSTDKNSTTVEYAKNQKIKIDTSTVLYAIWQYNTITLTLNGNGGIPETTTRNLTYGSKYTPLAVSSINPTRIGYTFDGWYTDATAGTKVTSNTDVTTTDNVTLYAHWKANTMTVTFDAKGGSVSPASYTVTYNAKYGTLPTPTRTGYTFQGWYKEAAYTNKVTADSKVLATSNHTLYAKWNPKTYTVTYNGNGATSGSTTNNTATYDTDFITNKNGYSKTGYTFNGWNEKADGTGVVWALTSSGVFESGKYWKWTYDKNITLYAQWKVNTYTVTYDANGGSAVAAQSKTHGATLGTLPSTTRSGYTFAGWYTAKTGGTQVSTSTVVTGNVTYYARWNVSTTVLTVNPNGGKVNNNTSNFTITQNVNTTYGLTVNTYPNAYTVTYNGNGGNSQGSATTKRTGVSWSRTGGGSISGNTFTFGTSNATVTASYSGSTSVTLPNTTRSSLTFWRDSADDRAGYDSDSEYWPDATETYYTYSFNGWYTATSGGSRVGGSGSSYTPAGNITLYAQWSGSWKSAKIVDCTKALYVHTEASASSDDYGTISKGTVITPTGYSNGYFSINWTSGGKTVTGWVAASSCDFEPYNAK